MTAETKNQVLTFIGGIIILGLVAGCMWYLWPEQDKGSYNNSLMLSRITIVSLAIVVALMGGLAAIYSVLNLTNNAQPLGLPEGSIRALISFSLILIFVCMSSFIYSGLSAPDITSSGAQLKGLTQTQVDDLRTHFVVVYQPSRTGNTKLDFAGDGSTQLFDATYFTKRGTAGDDFAKQLFTTLATVFVSVVSFYFGSSTTTSAIAAANAASGRQVDGGKPGGAGGAQPGGGAGGAQPGGGAGGAQPGRGAGGAQPGGGAGGAQPGGGAGGAQPGGGAGGAQPGRGAGGAQPGGGAGGAQPGGGAGGAQPGGGAGGAQPGRGAGGAQPGGGAGGDKFGASDGSSANN